MIVEMDMYEKIRSYYNDGKSIRWIARTLGISRQTVKKYCSGDTMPGIRKESKSYMRCKYDYRRIPV